VGGGLGVERHQLPELFPDETNEDAVVEARHPRVHGAPEHGPHEDVGGRGSIREG
jgi:hypothetical protein